MEDNDNGEFDHSDSGLEDSSSDPEEDEEIGLLQLGVAPQLIPSQVFPAMNRAQPSRHVFDADLPSLHSYLGKELEEVRGRTVLEDNAKVTLDILQPPGQVVLMPGQTLPLTVFDPVTINMLRNCLRNDRTFGVLASWGDDRNSLSDVGTTAEIFEYLPDEGSIGFRVKAKARQRFKLLQLSTGKAKAQILPEVRLPDPLEGVGLQSLNRHRTSPALKKRLRRTDAAVTYWPAFVYDQYDIERLMRDIKKELFSSSLVQRQKDKGKEKAPVKVVIPDDPTELSFWVAQNIPMRDEHRMLLLKLNSPIQRLRYELRALQQIRQVLICQFCFNDVGYCTDIFSMSTEGPQGTYVNPGGYLHETITLYKVKNIFSVGPPSTEFSWFPGYGWSICKCKHCNQHMGWKFTAMNNQLKPAKFWGICRRSIKMGTVQDEENHLLVF